MPRYLVVYHKTAKYSSMDHYISLVIELYHNNCSDIREIKNGMHIAEDSLAGGLCWLRCETEGKKYFGWRN